MFKKTKSKKGFTLVELLIVLAIIAILAAIAIPMYKSQMDKARLKVDEANMRSAQSMAVAEYMLDVDNTTAKTYYFKMTGENLEINYNGSGVSVAPAAGYNQHEQVSADPGHAYIKVEVSEGGQIVSSGTTWVKIS